MGSVDPLALYGALVASVSILVAGASLGWQVYTWRRERRPDIEVKVSMGILGTDTGHAEKAVILTAVNRSTRPIRVTSTGLLLQDASRTVMTQIHQYPGAGLPGTIGPSDSAMTWFDPEEVARAGIDVFKPVTAQVIIASGEVIRSKAHPLFTGRRATS